MMNPKTIKILYWVLTILFALSAIADGYGGITKQEAGKVVLRHLGYPIYIMPFFGVLKVLGATAILQQKYKTLKEWAYAGFAFTFISAFVSRMIVGDGISDLLPPVIMLVILFAAYFLWDKFKNLKTT